MFPPTDSAKSGDDVFPPTDNVKDINPPPLVACGVHSVDTKGNYIEILRFKLFHDHFEFVEDEHNFKEKKVT